MELKPELFISVSGVIISLFALSASRQSNKLTTFFAFTERYNKVYNTLINKWDEEYLDAKTKKSLINYLDLCSEEYFYRRRRYIPRALWNIWSHEIKERLSSPLIVNNWDELKGEFKSYQKFQKWVDGQVQIARKHSQQK